MEELLQLKTEVLKDAAQKLWKNMCAPTCDGILFPADIDQAYRNRAASGIEFIFGIPGDEMPVYRSFVGNQNYEEFVSIAIHDIRSHIDDPAAAAMENYIKAQTAQTSELEARSEFIGRWIALCMYRSACALSEAGNKVHVMYWDKKPLIENLGSGTVDALAALLGNSEALRMYGNLMDEDDSEILRSFLHKFVNGEDLQLYPNEILQIRERNSYCTKKGRGSKGGFGYEGAAAGGLARAALFSAYVLFGRVRGAVSITPVLS